MKKDLSESNRYNMGYDEARECLDFWHPEGEPMGVGAVCIRKYTLADMTFDEASGFIGSTLILMMPAMREMFKDYLWSEDGLTPPKKPSALVAQADDVGPT